MIKQLSNDEPLNWDAYIRGTNFEFANEQVKVLNTIVDAINQLSIDDIIFRSDDDSREEIDNYAVDQASKILTEANNVEINVENLLSLREASYLKLANIQLFIEEKRVSDFLTQDGTVDEEAFKNFADKLDDFARALMFRIRILESVIKLLVSSNSAEEIFVYEDKTYNMASVYKLPDNLNPYPANSTQLVSLFDVSASEPTLPFARAKSD